MSPPPITVKPLVWFTWPNNTLTIWETRILHKNGYAIVGTPKDGQTSSYELYRLGSHPSVVPPRYEEIYSTLVAAQAAANEEWSQFILSAIQP